MNRGGDPWLDRWLPLLRERAGTSLVLELGCGEGEDTATLTRAGLRVTAVDISAERIGRAELRVPDASYQCQDVRAPFPVEVASIGVVVASLSLHYFSWPETTTVVARIRAALRPSGILLCRLNSTNDHNYGASGHERIADNYYCVDGKPKRFFDCAAVTELFRDGWKKLAAKEMIIHRYARPKIVWEAVLERDG